MHRKLIILGAFVIFSLSSSALQEPKDSEEKHRNNIFEYSSSSSTNNVIPSDRKIKDPQLTARIIDGTQTAPGRYPYMVSLQKVLHKQTADGTEYVFFAPKCGGTLVAEGKFPKLWRRGITNEVLLTSHNSCS